MAISDPGPGNGGVVYFREIHRRQTGDTFTSIASSTVPIIANFGIIPSDRFGDALAFAPNPNFLGSLPGLIIGAPNADHNGPTDSGEVYLADGTPLVFGAASAPVLGANARFGKSLTTARNAGGDWLFVGSNQGVYVYRLGAGTATYQPSMSPLTLPAGRNYNQGDVFADGDVLTMGVTYPGNPPDPQLFSSGVEFFRWNGSMWSYSGVITTAQQFAAQGGRMVTRGTGRILENFVCGAGTTRVWAYNAGSNMWTTERTLPGSTFGAGLAIDGSNNTAAVGTVENCCIFQPCSPAPQGKVQITTAGAAATPSISGVTTACAGAATSVLWTANSTDTPPLTYRWLKGTTVVGTASTLQLGLPLDVSDAGAYTLQVTNACGVVASTSATMTVNIAPAFSSQPSPATVCAAQPASFMVVATGTPAPTYQWRRNGTNISGAMNATYNIASVVTGNAGTYDCVVTNTCGSLTSTGAALVVNSAPVITSNPTSPPNICVGQSTSFTVVANASASPTYQWRKGGVNIGGAINPTYSITGVAPANAGTYDCVVTNACGSQTSTAATLTVNVGPSITAQPTSVVACLGQPASLTVGAIGTPAPTYQWRKGGANIGGATGATYLIASVAANHVGTYDCVVTNLCGTVTSSSATLSLATAPSITTQPVGGTYNQGQTAILTAAASGTNLAFDWQYFTGPTGSPPNTWLSLADGPGPNGETIAGQGTSVLQIQTVQPANAGQYRVIVSGLCTPSQTSNPAMLTIVPICPTGSAGSVITYQITGSPTNVTWQWRMDSTSPSNPFQNTGLVTAGPVPTSGTTRDIANEFARSINAQFLAAGCTAPQINAVGSGNFFGTFLSVQMAAGATYDFFVRNTSGQLCQLLPSATCTFNPGMERLLLPGADCNGNGLDDLIDIAVAASVDANGNSIPDECELPCTIAIASRPLHRSIAERQTVAFAVTVNSTNAVTYQWHKDGVAIFNGPSGQGGVYTGATSPMLTVTNIRLGDAGRYSARVFNACGDITSTYGELFVTPGPCVADVDDGSGTGTPDGGVTIDDLLYYLAIFEAGSINADVDDGSGTGTLDGGVTIDDLLYFLLRFESGC